MTYSIKNTRNTEVDTVADNTLKTTAYGIRVPGKNYSGYGEAVGQTLLHILENHACPNNGSNLPNPTNSSVNLTTPNVGQLWYDTTNDKLRAWDGSAWSVVSGAAAIGTSPPGAALIGDLWWNTTTEQLFGYDGTSWVLIGPASDGTVLTFVRSLKINAGGTGGAGSGDAAAPTGGVVTDALGVFNNNLLTGVWTGTAVASPTFYYIDLSDGSGNVRYYSFSPYDALIEVGLNIGIAATTWFNGQAKYADAAGSVAGITATNFMRNDNGAGASTSRLPTVAALDIGNSTTGRWQTMFATTFDGTATAAQYSDLAERYEADMNLEPGDVVKIGGAKEITKTTDYMDSNMFGVVSTQPGFMLNSAAGTDETHPFIALAGRVNVKVIGKVNKGQRLVSSTEPGVATIAPNGVDAFAVIGRALGNKDTDGIGLLEIVVGTR